MITDQIGRHEVLLPINHNYNKVCDVLALLKIKKKQEIQRVFLLAGKKRPFKCAHDWRILSNYIGMTRSVLLSY